MSVQAHPRFLRRRASVREHRARSHLRRALWVLLVVVAGWGVAWLAQSPFFSVATIEVAGAERTAVDEILEQQNVYPGRPLILIRSGAVAEALEADPWVQSASVRRVFPDQIDIQIEERIEVAVVPATDGWRTVSNDGHIMTPVAEPPAGLALVSEAVAVAGPGGERVSELVLGVVEFVAALPGEVRARTEVTAEAGDLMALIDGYRIRLGNADNMEAKAAALMAVLADPRLPAQGLIDVIAPTRPAFRVPSPDPPPLLEGEDKPLEAPGTQG